MQVCVCVCVCMLGVGGKSKQIGGSAMQAVYGGGREGSASEGRGRGHAGQGPRSCLEAAPKLLNSGLGMLVRKRGTPPTLCTVMATLPPPLRPAPLRQQNSRSACTRMSCRHTPPPSLHPSQAADWGTPG